jgi:ribose-phosphate pyrophosphokinase
MKIFSINKTILSKKILDNFPEQNFDKNLKIDKFSDGEFCPIFLSSIREEEIYIIFDGHSSDDIIKLLLTIDAAKRSGSKSISIIAPYLPYSRSDKNDHIRQSISAKLLADILTSVGISKIITIDLHNASIQGFYNVPVIHLLSNKIFINYIKYLNLENLCFVAPDHGATKRNLSLLKIFNNSSFAVIDKKRVKFNEISSMNLINSVENKNVVIFDDIGDTLGTICKASELLLDKGAESVRAILTHAVLSGESLSKLSKSKINELIVSDTIPNVYDKVKEYNNGNFNSKITIISCSDLISNSIEKLSKHESINELNLS